MKPGLSITLRRRLLRALRGGALAGALAAAAFTPRLAHAADKKAAVAFKQQGDAAAAAGKKPDALAAYEQAIDADPSYFDAYDAAAPLWFDAGDYAHATARLRAAVKLDKAYAMGWYNLAFSLRKQGDNAGAVDAYQKFAALRPGDPDPYFGLGMTYKAMGETEHARASFKKYLELEQRADKGKFIERAKAELAALDQAAAAPAAGAAAAPAAAPAKAAGGKPAAAAPRERAAAVEQKGDARRDAGDAAGAEKLYREAAELDPTWGAPHNELGTLLFQAGKTDAAITEFELAVKLEPSNEVAWYNLAYAYRKAGHHDRAVDAYHKYIALAPNNPDPYYGLGESLLALGKRADARAAFARYVELETRPSEKKWVDKAKQQLAAIDAQDRKATAAPGAGAAAAPAAAPAAGAAAAPAAGTAAAPAAGTAAAPAAAPAPVPGHITPWPAPTPEQTADAKTFLDKGDSAFSAKRYAEAVGDYRGAVAATPQSIDARYKLGVALAAAGDLTGAIAAWEGVLLLDPAHDKSRRNIELARKRLAHTERAPVDEVAVLAHARSLVDDGRYASALAMLDDLLADPLHAQNLDALALRADARLGSGDPAGAVTDWLTVLALDPRSSRAYHGLADAYTALGDTPRATYFRSLGTQLGQ